MGAFVLAGTAAAFAFWTVGVNNGSGSYAAAQADSLAAPTTPTATPSGGGTITVGWTLPGSQLPGAEYQVTRTSPGSPTTVCTVASTATSCQDTGLTANTSYSYSISAILDDWQSSAITASATTATPNFVITLSSGPYTAGTAATVQTIQAMIGASVDTTYSGVKTITWSGLPNSPSNQAPSYPSSAVTFTNGVANPSSAFTAYAAGSNTLTATDASATAVTGSTSFTVVPAGAHSMVFTTQTTGAAGTVATTVFPVQPVVTVKDLYGNTAVSYATPVSLTISAGQTLGCTATSVTPTAGVAAFAGCHGNTFATGVTLTATSGGLPSVTSASFNITRAASKLIFTTQPSTSTTAGSAFATQPVVSVEDRNNRVVTADSATQVQLTAGGGSGTLTCTTQTPTVTLGVAAFDNCSINKSGTYTLTAAAAGLTSATSNNLTITAGPATQLVFTTQPGGGRNAANWTTQPAVTVEDSLGNTVTTPSASVTLSINSQPGAGATLSCTTNPKTTTTGVVSFAGCNITGQAGTYTLTAAAAGLTSAASNNLTISVGPATQLVLTTQPGGGPNAANWSTQPVVTVEDSGGNTVTTPSASVTLSINSPPGTGATLSCTTNPLTSTSGVASFAGCKITGKAGSYTLTAAAPGLTSATSNNLTITVGTATQLVFTTQPGGGANAANWSTQPVVTVEDSGGNTVTTSGDSVTLSINTQPGTGATLSCTTNPQTPTSGVASFAGCDITGKAGTYTLTAAATGLTSATSNSLTITVGTATQLGFTTQPGGGATGATWTTQPVVAVEDSGGNTVTTSSASVTLSINTQPGTGATLSCTTNPKTTASGVATFAGCDMTGKSGTYTLTAAAAGLTSATSSNLTISAGPATKLAFTTEPGGGPNGATWSTQPVVTVEDSLGNTVTTSAASVTLSINTQPGTGATLSCTTNPLTASGGVASFAGCDIAGQAGTYTLKAAAAGLTSATSNSLTITVGTATQLVFSTQPGGGTNGANWSTQPVVTVEDTGGNTVTTSSASVTLSINSQPGTGATLSCTTNPLTASGGVASFAGCDITGKAGTYTLTASATGLTSATSSNLTISVGTASQLGFTTQPGGGPNAATWTTQPVVAVEDSGGNTITTSSASVTLSINSQPGTGATLSCTTNPKTTASGVAAFAGCDIIGKAGTYTLTAAATGLTSATSNNLTITFGAATQLVFTTQPGGGTNGAIWTTQPVVTVEDSGGNTVTTSTASINLAINTGSGTLFCTTNPKAAASGVATFSGCRIFGTGTYTLNATATGLTTDTSDPFAA